MRNKVVGVIFTGLAIAGCSASETSGGIAGDNTIPPVSVEIENVQPELDVAITTVAEEQIESEAATTTTEPVDCTKLKLGIVGCAPEITELQITLDNYQCNPGTVDGIYGNNTEAAVTWFQVSNDLFVDGEAYSQTMSQLESEDKKDCFTPEVATTTTLAEEEPTVEEIPADLEEANETTTTIEVPIANRNERIQEHSNSILSQFGFPELRIDGDLGKFTRQAACLARSVTGQVETRADFPEDDNTFFDTSEIVIPESLVGRSGKSVYGSLVCQGLIFVENDTIVRIMPTSSGETGSETRQIDAPAYLYRPALDNGGWHNSTDFPAPEDNPVNGNMYKPLYLDGGIAIHGAKNIPSTPASKGCLRLSLSNQEWLISWLGLENITETTGDQNLINLYAVMAGQFEDKI